MTTSPQTLLWQRQQVTFLVPSLLFRHLSTSRHLRRPGARNRAGLTPRRIPDSPSHPPTSPAFLSLTLLTRTSSKEVRGALCVQEGWASACKTFPAGLECLLTWCLPGVCGVDYETKSLRKLSQSKSSLSGPQPLPAGLCHSTG